MILVWIRHKVFNLFAGKDHLAYAASKLADSGGCGPDKWQIIESVSGFLSLVKFIYPAFLLDAVWAFTLSWSTRYQHFQTPASTWSSVLSAPDGRESPAGDAEEGLLCVEEGPVCVEEGQVCVEEGMGTKCGRARGMHCSLYMIFNYIQSCSAVSTQLPV